MTHSLMTHSLIDADRQARTPLELSERELVVAGRYDAER